MVFKYDKLPTISQKVDNPLSYSALMVTLKIKDNSDTDIIINALQNLSNLVRAVGFRIPNQEKIGLSCICGISNHGWDVLFPNKTKPKELEDLPVLVGKHTCISTEGDIFLHIRHDEFGYCEALFSQILKSFDDSVEILDMTSGFKRFENRDYLGFVDGTENPQSKEHKRLATLIGYGDPNQDEEFTGGSYLVTQKYIHNIKEWVSKSISEQEKVIGRTKLADIELEDDVCPSYAHKELNTITYKGQQLAILRDNMPFIEPKNESEYDKGTYFLGYASQASVVIQMLKNMFLGSPKGNYDRILDISTPLTGVLWFIPTQTWLDNLTGQENNGRNS